MLEPMNELNTASIWESYRVRAGKKVLSAVAAAWRPYNRKQMAFEMTLHERAHGYMLAGERFDRNGKSLAFRILEVDTSRNSEVFSVEDFARREAHVDLLLINDSIPGFPSILLEPVDMKSGKMKGYAGQLKTEFANGLVVLSHTSTPPGDLSGECWEWTLSVWIDFL
ncbi:hypothetical protein ACEWPM_019625 [Roseovarius sp. S4756]|uniref:hypothetical protein n=1 Tax=Roseovarius maritimus TaxID=3342637 RepID=UPI003729C7E9